MSIPQWSQAKIHEFHIIKAKAYAQAVVDQCERFLSRLISPDDSTTTHPDVKELNDLFAKFRHRENLLMFVNNHTITGFITRTFVEESRLRTSGNPVPSNNMIFPVVHKDRESGIREIMESIREVDVEHSWAYLPTKKLWIDVTIAVSERSVYSDRQLLGVLHETYGPIEIFHTHPEKLIDEVRRERKFEMSHLVSGSIPTVSDLSHIISYAWNWNRTTPFFSGIIHPLGVTYYSVTEELLRSQAGPPIADIGNTFSNLKLSGNDLESNIHKLIKMQISKNAIQKYDSRIRDPEAFAIEFFAPEHFDQISQWLDLNAASLSKEEATALAERRKR